MMLCVCGHQAEEHVSEVGRCTVIGCGCGGYEADPPSSQSPEMVTEEELGPGAWD